jgi:hypothetical protein
MAAANSNIQLTGLDFTDIKTNFISFLKNQDTFKDYNFSGSGLNVLLDVLAYNTQYNAFYLNMVANEMFLDTAQQRSSVVSLAKMMNYTPQSNTAPTATVNVAVYGVSDSFLTLPKYSRFMSKPLNGTNYTFLTTDDVTVQVTANTATFSEVEIKQGVSRSYNFTYTAATNPTSIFDIPDPAIDTSTLIVQIQQSSSNSSFQIYKNAAEVGYSNITSTSPVYFLQEGISGNYQIYFGDGVLGQALTDGNIVKTTFISTQGTASAGANAFTLMTPVGGYANTRVFPVTPATQGTDRESIQSIKYQAPKAYSALGRAVTSQDYITILQQNTLGYTFDAVNVWGGEEMTPPQYGNVFVAIKPTGGYSLTQAQKDDIINNVILPASVMTVTPNIVEPDYTYVLLDGDIYYDPKLTNLSVGQLNSLIIQGIQTYCNNTLNTFNSTFIIGDLINYVQSLNPSITAADFDIYLQKRIIPALNTIQSYTINFGGPIENDTTGEEALQVTPSFATYDIAGNYYPEVYFEPSPDNTTNIDSITINNGGTNYTSPVITISGDGTGATAQAVVQDGVITAINMLTGGSGYTQAIITITDSTGSGASASAVIRGDYGFLRTYYFNNGVKNVLTGAGASQTSNAGTGDFQNGIITLANFSPVKLNNSTGVMKVTGYSDQRVLSSTLGRILTLDVMDPAAITLNFNKTPSTK